MTFTLEELARHTGCVLVGDPDYKIDGVDCLQSANKSDASFLENPRYRGAFDKSEAGVVCVHPEVERVEGKNYLLSSRPSEAFQKIIELLSSGLKGSGFGGIHPSAVVHESAELEEGVCVGPGVVIDARVKIGRGTRIEAGAQIGHDVIVGEDCHFYQSSVVRERCQIGNRVILQPGAVIGSCGYGYLTSAQGIHTKIIHVGIVIIEDDVEVGANSTIDRGRFKATVIRAGTKIDNLVMIGHNVEVGKHNLIVAQVGISGSTKLGSHVVLGGQVGVAGHIEICAGVMVAAKGVVTKSVKLPGKYNGVPMQPLSEYNRQQVQIRRIKLFEKRLKILEEKVLTS